MGKRKSKSWSICVTCKDPGCMERFKITTSDIYLDEDMSDNSQLVPYTDCPECGHEMQVVVPDEIVAIVKGMI